MDTIFGATDFAEHWFRMAQGKVNTVGETIVSASESKTRYGLEWSRLLCRCLQECRNWEALAGDSLFTRSGSRYTAKLSADMLGSDPYFNQHRKLYAGYVERFDLRFYIEQLSELEYASITRLNSPALRSLSLYAHRTDQEHGKLSSNHTYHVRDTAPAATPPKGTKSVGSESTIMMSPVTRL